MTSSKRFHMRREVENSGNKPKSPCVGACTMVGKKNYKYVEGNRGGTYI